MWLTTVSELIVATICPEGAVVAALELRVITAWNVGCGGAVAIDPDVERMARYLIKKYGVAAERVARNRARELEKSGERGTADLWRDIADAIAALLQG